MREASPYPSGPCPPGAEGLRHDPKRNARRNGLRPAMTPETTPTKPGGDPQNGPQQQDCSVDRDVRWFSVTSVNDGIDWTPSHEIYHSTVFDWCVFQNRSENAQRAFGFARDPDGNYWAAVQDNSDSIRVFWSPDFGATWRRSAAFIAPLGAASVLFPTLAADADGRIGLSFYASEPTDEFIRRLFVGGMGIEDPASWSFAQPISPFFQVPDPGDRRGLGDYDGMAVVDPSFSPNGGTFVPAWTDARRTGPDPLLGEIAATYVRVDPP